jgi:hypothetical protein
MNKNNNTTFNIQSNLLSNIDFIEQLQILTIYQSKVSGGHSPFYLNESRRKSLVNPINVFSSEENRTVAIKFFISNN